MNNRGVVHTYHPRRHRRRRRDTFRINKDLNFIPVCCLHTGTTTATRRVGRNTGSLFMNESWIQKDSLFNGCCADGCLNCCCLVGRQKSQTRRNLVSCVPILMVPVRHIFRRKLNLHWRAWPKGLQCLHLELTLVNGARWTVSTWLMINSTQSMCQGYFLNRNCKFVNYFPMPLFN